MRKEQRIHVGMVNSFNAITKKASFIEIVNSGINIFAHSPEDKNEYETVKFIISYFKDLEMYEKCSELTEYLNKTFNDDGSYKEPQCDCDLPEIKSYFPDVKCSICNMKLRK